VGRKIPIKRKKNEERTILLTRAGCGQVPALAEGAAVGLARPFNASQQCGVERIGLGRIAPFAGTHALLFFAGGLLGQGRGAGGRDQKPEVRCRKPEIGGRRSED